MTLTEVVVSAVILGISTQVGLQGWASTAKASASAVLIDQQHQQLEQRLLASRRLLQASVLVDVACRFDADAVVDHLDRSVVSVVLEFEQDRSTLGGIFVGVFDQIEQHLTQPGWVGLGDRITLLRIVGEFQLQRALQGVACHVGHLLQLIR